MIRRSLGIALVATVVGGVVFAAVPAHADVDDFTITSFEADYFLGRDEDGRSTLKTIETIVAEFPEFDQNHGILRNLVESYRGQPTDLQVGSITDGTSTAWSYEEESEDGYLQLRIGDEDAFLHGTHTFVITYTQQNVTRYFADDGNDQFYWDVNGTEWAQPFGTVTARVHVAADLLAATDGSTACYRGLYGSTQVCDSELIDGAVYTASAENLAPNENLTFAIGFDEGTFVPRDNSPWASPFFYAQLFFALLALGTIIVALVLRGTAFADRPGRPTIVAEYLPPKHHDLIESSIVLKRMKRAVAAQLIDLAVRRNIRIIETQPTGLFDFTPDYSIEWLTSEGLRPHETRLLDAFFTAGSGQGETKLLEKSDTATGQRVYAALQSIKAQTAKGPLYVKVKPKHRVLLPIVGLAASTGTFMSFILVLVDGRVGLLPVLLVPLAVVAAIIAFVIAARKPLTEAGAEFRDHLAGLRLYIQVAETDRIRMLQSPEGAERIPVDTSDRAVMLKLYERVLPYAVLFDEEKRWAKLLGEFYDEQPPEWYSGSGAFSAVAFSSGISAVSSTASSGYSGTSSSSSGGSGGGGSSGGGGGGGGGGGW